MKYYAVRKGYKTGIFVDWEVGLILERTINKTNKFEDLEFKITPDDDSFDKLNQLIKEKRFSC